MPILKAVPKGSSLGTQIPKEMVEQYKAFIEGVDEGSQDGILEFQEGEDINLGKEAIKQAALELGKYIKITKPRKIDNQLRFRFQTKEEYEDAQEKAKARGEKIRGKRKAKAKK